MSDTGFVQWMTAIQQDVEATLDRVLPAAEHTPQTLNQAMRYAALGGGKRIRPLLACAAGELVGASSASLQRIAAAIELIHVYSLVHDDLPCMDDDVLRRGKPTCHVAYGEAAALLAGDALQTLAFDVLADPSLGVAAPTQVAMLKLLAHAAGHAGMAGGQAIDLASVGQALDQTELEYMHCLKTGALIRAAVLLGGMAGEPLDADAHDRLDRFAKRIGLAFQVVDDVLDCEADSATLGKTAGKDAANDKPTYVSLMGLREAKDYARSLRDDAFDALVPFGDRAQRLRALADYIVARSF